MNLMTPQSSKACYSSQNFRSDVKHLEQLKARPDSTEQQLWDNHGPGAENFHRCDTIYTDSVSYRAIMQPVFPLRYLVFHFVFIGH